MFTDVEAFEAALSTSGLAPMRNARSTGSQFRADAAICGLGPLRFINLNTPEGECFREARHAGPDDDKYWQVNLMTRGHARVEQGGNSTVVAPDDLTVIDPTRPVRFASTAASHVSLLIPRERLALRPVDSTRLVGARIPTSHGPGMLVRSIVQDLARSTDGMDPRSADRSAAAVIELVSVTLDAHLGLERSTPDDALRDRIVGYIEARLADVDLSPGKLAAAHHISIRRLHRLFEDQPLTVAAFIRRRRLEKCHTDLTRGDMAVGAVAVRWGFTDIAHFSRLFKNAYGYNAAALMSKNQARMVNASEAEPAHHGSHERTAGSRRPPGGIQHRGIEAHPRTHV